MLHLHHRKLIIVAITFLMSWLIGTFLIHRFESGYPIGESYFNAFYFTVITTATIGFGDLVPHTMAGKMLTMAYAIFYVPLFLYTMNIVFQANFERIRKKDMILEKTLHDAEEDVAEILDAAQRAKKDLNQRRIASK